MSFTKYFTGTVFDTVLRDVHCPSRNPRGIINMGIANNSLMEKELLELDTTDLTYGTSLHGSTRLFAALTKHFNRQIFSPVTPVRSEHLLTGPGCGALLDQLFEHLADPGEGVLVAAPYYNGFDADLATRSQVKCVPVHSIFGDGTEARSFTGTDALRNFEETLQQSQKVEAVMIKSVLICNPQNPVGRCYDRGALLAYGRFAEKHNLHLVFDEIYALSTFATSDDSQPTPFTSALNVDWASEAGCNPSRIHILTSASKDFGLNGFRLGVFVSQHSAELVSAMKVTTKLYMVSSPADALFSCLLTDDDFFSAFVKANQRRLSAAYEHIKAWCQRHHIPYTRSNAGHFLLVDFSRFLDQASTTKEIALWTRAFQERVCVTPGSNYHHPRMGVFRITFSMPQEILSEGLERLERALGLATLPPARITYTDGKIEAKSTSGTDWITMESLRECQSVSSDKRAGRTRTELQAEDSKCLSSRSRSPSIFKRTRVRFWSSSSPKLSTRSLASPPATPSKVKSPFFSRLSLDFALTSVGGGATVAAGMIMPEEQTEINRALDHVQLNGQIVGCLC